MKIVECVPNFSEGRNKETIKSITDEIEKVKDVKLLDVDPGTDTNRTVVTFIGTPEGVKEAAFQAIKKAAEVIDMTKHKGAHPRMGATDVCPFVPVSGITMEDCINIAKEVGKRVAEELNIPIYLYEEAAVSPDRKNLANVREGEYEGLPEKLKDPKWKPDFGKPVFNPKSGATIIGAREFLIAYNINLNTRDKKIANKIAFELRERGKAKRDKNGKIVRDKKGNIVRIPGRFKFIKAIGWYIPEYGIAQISINFTNYKVSPPHIVFDAAREEANKLGVRVTGSELVGLIPKEAMLEAGKYYLKKQGKCPGVPEKELIKMAVLSMGMNQIAPFKPEEKIIEYQIGKRDKLVDMKINDFTDELSTDSPAPGGGSVAALAGSLAGALSSMVANLTVGKKGYEKNFERMGETAIKSQEIKDTFLSLIDKDTEAFNQVMFAMRMSKKTDEEKKEREKAIQSATKEATYIPLEVMETCKSLIPLISDVAKYGNKNSISDAGVAALMGISAVESAFLNVLINLQNIKDEKFVKKIKEKAEDVKEDVKEKLEKIYEEVEKAVNE